VNSGYIWHCCACVVCRSSQSKLDYESVLLVTRYLASNRPFSQSFDIYLTQVVILCTWQLQLP